MSPEIPKIVETTVSGEPKKLAPVFVTRTILQGTGDVLPTWGDVDYADSVLPKVQAEASLLNPPAAETGETNA